MKNPLHITILLITNYFALTTCMAQAPQGIPYQAIARNASGQAIASTAVKVRFSIRDSIATGAIKYQETHNPTTSALGLFSVNVGMGTVVSGTFSGINWGKNAKFLQVEMDPAGGTTFTDLGTTQMMSVPYALYSSLTGDTTIWRKGNDGISYSGKYVEIGSNAAGEAGLVKNIPLNTPGYDGRFILGFCANYSTIELNHQLGGFRGGSNASNFFTTFNTTEGGVDAGERMRISPNGNVGIGTTSPQRNLHIKDVLRLEPRSSAPSSPTQGDIYFDSSIKKLRVYDGTVWQNCW